MALVVEVVAVGGAKGARQRITAGKVCFQPSLGTPAYVPVRTVALVELICNKVLAAGGGLEGVWRLPRVLKSLHKVCCILAAYKRILGGGGRAQGERVEGGERWEGVQVHAQETKKTLTSPADSMLRPQRGSRTMFCI